MSTAVPAVSVIIPVFNGAEFVAAAIESALAQTYCDAEIVVVDDGSSDATPAVLSAFGDRIRVIRQPNRGLPAARNRAIAAARGALLALLDADDLWEPTFLARTAPCLAARDASIVGVFAGAQRIDRDGRPLRNTRHVPRGRVDLSALLPNNALIVSAVVLRRAAVRAVGGFDEHLRADEDWDLWLRMAAAGGSFEAVEECLCRVRVHGGNMSGDPERMRAGALRALEKVFAHPALPPDVRARRAAITGTVLAHASWHFYQVGRDAEGARELRAAAQMWPALLLDDATHYAIICAEQPIEWKATPHHLDLERGARRLFAALASCFGEAPIGDARLARQSHARAYRALAQLAYGQRRMDAARRYAARALGADPSLWRDPRTFGPLLKSFAGGTVIDALSRRRQPFR